MFVSVKSHSQVPPHLQTLPDVRTSQLPGLAAPVAGAAVWVDALIWPSHRSACLSASDHKSSVQACR